MSNSVQIENIEEMRQQEGIDDVELLKEIQGLRIGDFVKLTFVNSTKAFETLSVEITHIEGCSFRAKLAKKPAATGFSKLRVGAPVVFTTSHIHSVLKKTVRA